jgi:hypothetical protein
VIDLVVAICKVVASSVADRTAAILLDLVAPGGEDESTGERAVRQPEFGALGVIARPPAPSGLDGREAYAEAIAVRTGNQLIPIAYRDARLNAFFSSISGGTVALVGYTGAFVRTGLDGVVSTKTTDTKTPTGRPVFYNVAPTGFQWESPYGRMRLDTTGFHVKEHGGARLDIGSLSMPSPLDAMSTYATLQAATVNLRGTLVNLGPDAEGVTRDAVALATPIATLVAALDTYLLALEAAIVAAVTPINTNTTFASTMGIAHGALTAAETVASAAIPSKSTTSA